MRKKSETMGSIIGELVERFALAVLLVFALTTESTASEQWTSPEILTSKPAPWIGETLWGTACSEKSIAQGGVGPVDYNRRNEWVKSALVEEHHFFPDVENLNFHNKTGAGEYTAGIEDLDYTLRAFPNHHRALNSMIRLRFDSRFDVKTIPFPPAECYLQRAVNFAPNDGLVYMLYGLLLHRIDMQEKALPLYEKAEVLRPNDPQVKYNIGLLFVDMGRYEDALRYANRVYSDRFPLQGLRRKLAEKGFDVAAQ